MRIEFSPVFVLLQVMFLSLCLPVYAEEEAASSSIDHRSIDDRIVVTLKMPVDTLHAPAPSGRMRYSPKNPEVMRRAVQEQAEALADRMSLVIEQQWPIHALRVNCVVYRLPESSREPVRRRSLVHELESLPIVDAVQPMNSFVVQSAGRQATAATAEADSTPTGKGVVIAIVDTGADLAHKAFAQSQIRSQIKGRDLVSDRPLADMPAEQHGTAILGLLLSRQEHGSNLQGLVPDASILLFRACWEDGHAAAALCNTFTLAKALAAVLDSRADIVNLSISGPVDPLLERLGALLVEDGKLLVAAGDSRQGFPGSVPGSVLAVEWSESGESVLTSLPGNRYGLKSGTSIDAARLTAALAHLKEKNLALEATPLLRSLLDRDAKPVSVSASEIESPD